MTTTRVERRWQSIELARVVLELESAFIVGSGEGDGLHDAVFCTDANGLPVLPGDTLAGILRHALAAGTDPATDETCCSVFGSQIGDEGEASRVRVSWAQVHGQDDTPVPFRGAKLDPVLRFLVAGVPRDHIRIGPHGAVDAMGKFDELLVPAGARFTFELVVDRSSPRSASDLVRLLQRRNVCLGGGTYHGLGRFRVVRAAARRFDLSDPDDRVAYGALPVALEDGDASVLPPMQLPEREGAPGWIIGSISLRPNDTWMIGGTVPSGREPRRGRDEGDAKVEWDRFPLTERRIVWSRQGTGERGSVVEAKDAPFLVPASAIRGALRHRTAFHARRLELIEQMKDGLSQDADSFADDWPVPLLETTEEVILFGAARETEAGAPGAVSISDTWVAPEMAAFATLQHVSLDRFTQGPMDGLLFDEAPLYQGEIRSEISIRPAKLTATARQALRAALDDLCGGRLQLGAGRGHGGFSGHIDWSDDGRWLEGDPT